MEHAFEANDFAAMLDMYSKIVFTLVVGKREWVEFALTPLGWAGVFMVYPKWEQMATVAVNACKLPEIKGTLTCERYSWGESWRHEVTETIPFTESHAVCALMRRLVAKVSQ